VAAQDGERLVEGDAPLSGQQSFGLFDDHPAATSRGRPRPVVSARMVNEGRRRCESR
jgi:hypothetical protein